MDRKFLIVNMLMAFCVANLFAGEKDLVSFDSIYPREIRKQGFQLTKSGPITITTAGAYYNSRSNAIILGYAWIIDSNSREKVWETRSERIRSKNIRATQQEEEVTLPAGVYEAYYSSFPYYRSHRDWDYDHDKSLGKIIVGLIKGFDFDELEGNDFDRICERFYLKINGDGFDLTDSALETLVQKNDKNALVHFFANHDDEYYEQGFELSGETELRIRATGELHEKGRYDYGWIIETESRQKVWQMDFHDTEPAGGASKNRKADQTITLEPGKYAAIFVTDDSHSPAEWNSPPPYDPDGWGMKISFTDTKERRNAALFDYQQSEKKNTILSITKVRDDAYQEQAFQVKKDGHFRIYALGEGRSGEMFDYGWIINAQTRERVWVMEYGDTDHAGGAYKNRVFDDVIFLKKGDYIACYQSDDSHAYGSWNANRPHDPRAWGMSIFIADKDMSLDDVKMINVDQDKNVIAKIWRVRNNANERVPFTLDKNSEIRVYALGEGSEGEMFDYGWIEKSNGTVVWEMRYRGTRHAGGAQKNRVFDDTIYLKAGDYVLYYESDGSHSFADWNATPPNNPKYWGVTLYKTE